MTRYQRQILQAVVKLSDTRPGESFTARRVASELVGTQTADSVRTILNKLWSQGLLNRSETVTHGTRAKTYWPTDNGRRYARDGY